MNANETNPLMFILEAAPERYIKTPAATVLALLKIAEGAAAVLGGIQAADYLRGWAAGWGEALPIELLKSMLPADVAALLPHGTLPSGGTAGTVLTAAAALCLCCLLLCLIAEGLTAPLLRFTMKGSKLLLLSRRAAFPASVGLAVSVTASCALSVVEGFKTGMALSLMLRPALVTAGCALVLWLYASYSRWAAVVISAVEYEIRLGFKESVSKEIRLGRDSFLLCLVFLAAAAAIFWFAGWRTISICIPALLALKYAAAGYAWDCFRRRHR